MTASLEVRKLEGRQSDSPTEVGELEGLRCGPKPHNSSVGATFPRKEAGTNLDVGSPVHNLHTIDFLGC